MANHTVKEAESLEAIAYRQGFSPDALWGAPENAGLREKRKSPAGLCTGDVIAIPERKPATFDLALERRLNVVRKGVPVKFSLRFSLGDDPRSGERYTLEADHVKVFEGVTDGQGAVTGPVMPDTKEVRIVFDDGDEYSFALGRLEPLAGGNVKGAKARLAALDLYGGPVDDKADEALAKAVRAFQGEHGLEKSGKLDEATLAALEKEHP
jgi:hypothetical protein